MARGEDVMVDEHLRELAARLQGPARLKSDLLTEARHGLLDAVEAYRESGLPPTEAQRRAVAEFGSPAQLLPSWQAELAVGALRGLSLRMLAIAGVGVVAGDLTWQGSSWSGGPRPPAGYLLLSSSVDWIWLGALLLAVAGLLVGLGERAGAAAGPGPGAACGGHRSDRRPGPRHSGRRAPSSPGRSTSGTPALHLAPDDHRAVLVGGGYFSLTRAARGWLLATDPLIGGPTRSGSGRGGGRAAGVEEPADGAAELAPTGPLAGQRPPARVGELVRPAFPAVDRAPGARHVAGAFQPAQRRIDGAGGQVQTAVAAGTQRLDDRVAVQRALFEHGEQQSVEVAVQRLGLHA